MLRISYITPHAAASGERWRRCRLRHKLGSLVGMLRLLLALLLTGCAASAPARPTATPPASIAAPAPAERPLFLFTVEREGRPTSYLHGSVHVLKQQGDGSEPAIDRAFEEADALVVEVDIEKVDQQALQALTLQLAMYPPDDDLTQHLSPEAWQQLLPMLEKLGLPASGAQRMRPWFLSITVAMLGLQAEGYSGEAGVDRRYLSSAHGAPEPHPVIELETAEQQLQTLAGLPEQVQLLMLEDALLKVDDNAYSESMFDAWYAGDIEGMAAVLFKPLRAEPRLEPLYEALFFARNRSMTERLVQLLEQDRSYFVVVGAGHLAGPGSIPELLRSRGYRVEQVRVAGAARDGLSE